MRRAATVDSLKVPAAAPGAAAQKEVRITETDERDEEVLLSKHLISDDLMEGAAAKMAFEFSKYKSMALVDKQLI